MPSIESHLMDMDRKESIKQMKKLIKSGLIPIRSTAAHEQSNEFLRHKRQAREISRQ